MNDPFLSLLVQLLPALIILAFASIAIRVAIPILIVLVAVRRFRAQLDTVARNLPKQDSPPSQQWIQQAATLLATWNQMSQIQQARLGNRKADMMAVFTSARMPFTPPPNW